MKASRVHRFLAGVMVVVLLMGGPVLWRQITGLNNQAAKRRLIKGIGKDSCKNPTLCRIIPF